MISTYKLKYPLIYQNYIIDLIEVPAPKKASPTKEGFEHIEVVVDLHLNDLFKLYPHLSFNDKGLSKELNPELEIKFDDCAVKFHYKSLEHIINIEKNETLMRFLNQSNILKEFKHYSPCISGTLPLNIHTTKSDLDILFASNNLQSFISKASYHFQGSSKFHSRTTHHQGLPTAIINFLYEDLQIELFCQDKAVYSQQANQHLLIEGRLIKILGEKFKNDIFKLKKSGLKTEIAFGEVLKIKNPYQKLLELGRLSDFELYERFSTT